MYKRIKDMLLNPKGIVQYTNDKTRVIILIICCYIILLSLPMAVYRICNYGLNSTSREIIIEKFSEAEPIDFQIISHKLRADDTVNSKSASVMIEELNVVVIFDPNYEFNNNLNSGLDYRYCIVFTEDQVVLTLAYNNSINLKLCDYAIIDDYIDFKDAKNNNNNEFWIEVFDITESVMQQFKWYYFIALFISLIIQNLFYIAVSTIMLMVFMRFIDGTRSWLYTKTYKMAVYCYLPCIIGNLLATLFNNYFLYIIGFVITCIYAYIVSRLMALSKIKN